MVKLLLALVVTFIAMGSAAAQTYRTLSPLGGGSHPAVLLVSGCSGFVAFNGFNPYEDRAAELQAAGYHVIFVDYLGRRGLKDCAGITLNQVGQDILEAANWTRGQPSADGARISVIGWSYGGGGVIAALMAMPQGPPLFSKVVMYYPFCQGVGPWPVRGTSALMLMGANDDLAPPSLCAPIVSAVPPSSLRVITYPDARHGFDIRSLPERMQYRNGAIGYNAVAAAASWKTVLDFLK